MRFGKRLLSWLLIFMLVIGQTAFAQGMYQDTEAHWAESAIETWSSRGILKGSDGEFRPSDAITRAEMMIIIDRLMDFQEKSTNDFSDLGTTWYTDAVLKNVEAGVIQGYEGRVRPEDNIKREEAIVMLGRALDIPEVSGATNFADNSSISSWSLGYIKAFSDAGYVGGRPGNLIAPQETISRGEVVKLMDNLVKGFYNQKGTYTMDVAGNVIINQSGVTLKDMEIAGNLIVAEGVGDGEVYLDTVAIDGDVIVKGGGENSIYFNSVTVGGGLVVKKSDGKIRIVASGSTSVKATTLKSGAILVEKELIGGGFETVVVPKSVVGNSKVVLTGNFKSFTALAKDLKVELSSRTVVDRVEVATTAEGFKISGAGKAGTMKVNASNVSTTVRTEKIEVAKNVTQVVSNGKEVGPGTTTTNTSASNSNTGSSGGGSSSGGSSGGSSSSGTTEVLVSGITFNYSGEKLVLQQGKTYKLNVSVSPSNATNQAVSWGLSTTTGAGTTVTGAATSVTTGAGTVTNGIISVDQTGLVTASNTTGAATVVVMAKDGSGVSNSLLVEVSQAAQDLLDVKFYNGETLVNTAQVASGAKVTPPSVANVDFWYIKGGAQTAFDFNTPITGNMELVAKLDTSQVVIVSFDTGTYGSEIGNMKVKVGDTITGSIHTNRYGYKLNGWLLDGKTFDVRNTPITESIELVADWSLNTAHYSSDPLQYRDSRFAQGYPKMELVDETWTLKVKLADASPATVSMVFSRYMDDTDVTNVIHGHLGFGDDGLDAAHYDKTTLISDTNEHIFNTGVETSEHHRLIGSAFVIDQDGTKSTQATVVISPGLVTSALDESAPQSHKAFLSTDKSKIVLDFNEDLDGTTTIDPSDFSFTGLNGASVTKAYRNEDEDKLVLEVTGFDNYQEDSGLVFKYTGDDIKDEAGNVVTSDDLKDVDLVFFVMPTVTKVALDGNGQNVGTLVNGSTVAFADVQYFDGTTELEVESISGWRSSSSLEEYSKLEAAFDTGNIANLHVKVDFDGDVMTLLGNVDVIQDTGATDVKVTDPVAFEDAFYDTTTKELEILLTNNYNDYRVLACSFTLRVNGTDYQLRGVSDYIEMHNDAYNRVRFNLSEQDIPVEIGDTVTVTYQEQHQVGDYTDAFLRNDAYKNPVTINAVQVNLQ